MYNAKSQAFYMFTNEAKQKKLNDKIKADGLYYKPIQAKVKENCTKVYNMLENASVETPTNLYKQKSKKPEMRL